MTLRRSVAFLVVLLGLAQVAPAHAQIVKRLGHSVATDFRRNNCWPRPFLVPDRHAARAPFEQMVEAGWKHQNLLGEHHFDEQTGELTEAGELKVDWIVRRVPEQHRAIFVSRAETPDATAERIDAVSRVAGRLAGGEEPPAVLESNLDAGGWPAGRVDAIGRKFEESLPVPVLREPTQVKGGG